MKTLAKKKIFGRK